MIKWGVQRGGGASRVRSGWDDKNVGSLAVEFVLLQFGLEEGLLCLGLFGTPGIAARGLGAAFLLFDALHESDGPFDFELNQIVQLEVGQEEVVEERFHVDGLVGEDKGIHQSILCLVQGRFGDVFSNFHTAHLNIILSVLLQNIYTHFSHHLLFSHFSPVSLTSSARRPYRCFQFHGFRFLWYYSSIPELFCCHLCELRNFRLLFPPTSHFCTLSLTLPLFSNHFYRLLYHLYLPQIPDTGNCPTLNLYSFGTAILPLGLLLSLLNPCQALQLSKMHTESHMKNNDFLTDKK